MMVDLIKNQAQRLQAYHPDAEVVHFAGRVLKYLETQETLQELESGATVLDEPETDYSEWKTYDDWNDSGYFVLNGERATWANGKPLFSPDQVKERNW